MPLEWDVGTLFLIPMRMRSDALVTVEIEGNTYAVPLMHLVILGSLIFVAYPSFSKKTCNEFAKKILVKGWKSVEI